MSRGEAHYPGYCIMLEKRGAARRKFRVYSAKPEESIQTRSRFLLQASLLEAVRGLVISYSGDNLVRDDPEFLGRDYPYRKHVVVDRQPDFLVAVLVIFQLFGQYDCF